ncbi:hypothetical protein VLK31_34790 [Variovorax sp. H27-G14]
MAYQVIDIRTGLAVGKPLSKQAARNKRDRLDLAFGGVRYVLKAVQA